MYSIIFMGQTKQFLPNSCRDFFPIKASKHNNDDPEMKELLNAANKEHEAYRILMAKHAN